MAQILNLIILLSLGVVLVFVAGVLLDLKMKRDNRRSSKKSDPQNDRTE